MLGLFPEFSSQVPLHYFFIQFILWICLFSSTCYQCRDAFFFLFNSVFCVSASHVGYQWDQWMSFPREHWRNTMALAGCPDYFLHHSNYQVNIYCLCICMCACLQQLHIDYVKSSSWFIMDLYLILNKSTMSSEFIQIYLYYFWIQSVSCN